MAQLRLIRDGLRDRIATVDGLHAYDTVPDQVVVPAALIRPAQPFVEYQTAMGGSVKAQWRFQVTVLTNRVNEGAAQDALDDYVSPDGALIAAIHGNGGVLEEVADFATCVRGERYGTFRVGSAEYFGVQLLIEVMA